MARKARRNYSFCSKEMFMHTENLISAFKSVVLTSDDPEKTAAFYRDALGLPLEEERHRGTLRHWAGMVGEMHLAVHPREGFWLPTSPKSDATGTIVSFTVGELGPIEARLAENRIEILARTKIGPMSFIAVRDPDGRHVCLGTPWPQTKRAEA